MLVKVAANLNDVLQANATGGTGHGVDELLFQHHPCSDVVEEMLLNICLRSDILYILNKSDIHYEKGLFTRSFPNGSFLQICCRCQLE